MIQNWERILNCAPSAEMKDDWTMKEALAAGFIQEAAVCETYDIDLREPWWTINEQGKTGSCVGWAIADGLLRWHFVKKGILRPDELLSARFIWMASKETDELNKRPTTFLERAFTSIKAGLDVARQYGCVPDSMLPFYGQTLYLGSEKTFFAEASRFKICNYFNLVADIPDKILVWKQWMAAGKGPIAVRLIVDANWFSASEREGNLDQYNKNEIHYGHAALIVGYTNNRFIIRNSWGVNLWGQQGFAYASENYAREAFTEAYGINI